MKQEKYYITTAIDYVNSPPHIGTAYEKIGTDVLARFHRLQNGDVRFQMGNDEHSINVKKSADAEGTEPKLYCDKMAKKFISTWKDLNISFDDFIRTTDPKHRKSVQKLFQTILDRGDIYQDTYEGWYCESCEAFMTDKDLVDGKCPNHKAEPKWLKEDNYFFALSKYQDRLLEHIKKHPEFILPEVRRNEVVKMIEMGLNNISVSRSSVDWGITLPHDSKHVVYVWFDALINYITAVGYGTNEEEFNKWWPADVHVIGKDIIRFHCVIWPAMLMSAGIPLPKTVFAHGFVYLKGEKMSKSLGNVVTPLDITEKYGEDPLRYFLLREAPFGRDTDFTWETFINRYNGDLANGIGNLISRTVGMINRYLEDEVPVSIETTDKRDAELKERALRLPDEIAEAMIPIDTGLHFNVALAQIWEGITATDKYINENKPWELKKAGDINRIRIVISNVVESIRILTALLHPFIPTTTDNIWLQFGFEKFADLADQHMTDIKKWGFIKKPLKIGGPQTLFPRIEEEINPSQPPPAKPPAGMLTKGKGELKEKKMTEDQNLIDISDFAKLDLRVAEITQAEKIEGADKLLRIQVSLGTETRQIVAGIAKSYSTEELIGKKIIMVTNLKPAKLKGVESQGMLLAASSDDVVSILTPLKDVPAGSKVK